jgi:acyl-CoA synthetase (NDP forming)
LDYHTYIWGDLTLQTACFTGLLASHFDNHLLVLDFPRQDHCEADSWQTTLQSFMAAQAATGARASVLSSLPEGLPEAQAQSLLALGIAPMMGVSDALQAIGHAAFIGERQRVATQRPFTPLRPSPCEGITNTAADQPWVTLDEAASKQALRAYGLQTPASSLLSAADLEAQAAQFHYPVVLKAVSASLAHKTEAGGVKLNLQNPVQLMAALQGMQHLSSQFLVETMVQNPVAELIVGLHQDAQFGLALTLGSGGVLVELLQDSKILLLPTNATEIRKALNGLQMAPLLHGYRGRPMADVDAAVVAVQAIAAYALDHAATLCEMDINPLLVMPQGQGAWVVDALIRHTALFRPIPTPLPQ